MKKLIFVSLCLFLMSCKKEASPESTGTLSLRIGNGLPQTFDLQPSSPESNSNFTDFLFRSADNTIMNISIIKNGTEQDRTVFALGESSGIQQSSASIFSWMWEIEGESKFYAPPTATLEKPQGSITISKWTAREIEGTFSCTLSGQSKPNVKVEVTEGKFYVKMN